MDEVNAIFNECLDGNSTAIKRFIHEGVSSNIQNSEGDSLLHLAAANGFTDVVEILLNNGALIDLPNNYGWTPLMHAARNGHSEIVSLLIRMRAKVNTSNRLGLRAIDFAAWSGNDVSVNLLIDAGSVIDNMDDQNDLCDLSPLMAATLQGHESVIRILLERGSSINQASPITGLSPLMLAACNGYLHIVKILIQLGIDVNTTDKCGHTALDLAVACNNKNVKTYLEDLTVPNLVKTLDDVINTNILLAVRSGNIDTVKSLLQQNQSLCNYLDPSIGLTPLMFASMYGYNNIIEVLITCGADINAQDLKDGWTPLMYAVFHRQSETVHLLLEKCAKVDICSLNGYTALDLAVHIDSSETDIVETLLAHSTPEDLLETQDYFAVSPSSTIRKSCLSAEKVSSRGDSPVRLKDWIGGLSSHLRSRSKSSATSSVVDCQSLEASMSEVFIEDSSLGKPLEGHYISISKLYAPNQRFAHVLKEQEVEAIVLPPLPSQPSYVDSVKRYSSRKNRSKSKHSKSFSSLQCPNLIKSYIKRNQIVGSTQITDKRSFFESLQDPTLKNSKDLKCNQYSLLEKLETKEVFSTSLTVEEMDLSCSADYLNMLTEKQRDKENLSNKAGTPTAVSEGLTEICQGSLKKYAKKFREQEIDLETFQYLTEDDLSEIGVQSLESRNKFMEIIQKFKNS